MGCSSDVGCLGPKPRQRQVYVDLIQAIHDEVMKMNLQADKDSYKQIKERLMKKGLLRKLIDNLVSHRANILECINQNFQIISQNSVHAVRVAGLVIMDKIIEQLHKSHKTVEENGELLFKKNSGLKASSHYKNLTEPSIPSTRMDENNYSLIEEIDHRLDLIFFKFILFLLENEQPLYRYILESVNYFASRRQDKLGCKSQILQISSILIRQMKNKRQTEASSKTMSILLGKIKENIRDVEIDQSNLIFFIKNWVELRSTDLAENQITINNFEQIIKQYFSRYFLNYQILFFSALKIFDQLLFEQQKIKLIFQMFAKIIKFQDIQVPFMRGIFVYLLKYLTIRENNQISSKQILSTKQIDVTSYKNIFSEISKIRGFKLLTKWILNKQIEADQIIAYNSSSFLLCYITNITMSSSESFANQLKKQLLEVTPSLNIRSNQIILNFLIENVKEKDQDDRTRMILINIIKNIMATKKEITEQEILKDVNFIINIEQHYCLSMKVQILNFMKELFRCFKSGTFNQNTEANINLRSKICGLFHSFYQNVVYNQNHGTKNDSSEKTIFSNQLLNDKQSEQFLVYIRQKYELVKEMMKFIQSFIEQNLHIFVLPFLENLADCISKTNLLKENREQQVNVYFLIVIIQQSLKIMNQKQKIDDRIVNINLQLERGIMNKDIQLQMRSTVQKLCKIEAKAKQTQQLDVLSHNYDTDCFTNNMMIAIQKNIQSIKKKLILNNFQYQLTVTNYKEYFINHNKTLFKSEQPDLPLQLKFSHRSSSIINEFNDLNIAKNSDKTEEQSFRDIMERINEF